MDLWELDLVAREQGLQVFLRGLLRMKGDDVPERILRYEPLNCAEIQVGLYDPLRNQLPDFVLRPLHRALCHICAPDRQFHR